MQADGGRDTVACGLGLDIVNAEHHDVVADDCEVVTRQLSRDPFTGVGQHETQVEPDSASFGSTIVAVFQSGRIFAGGAEGTGWATSVDAGRTWRRGFLERVDDRASDPVVAYDRLHRTWLIATLGVAATGGGESSHLLVSRSADGLAVSRPAPAADDPAEDYDKEWLACDTWTSSPFYGRCYLVYLDGCNPARSAHDGRATAAARGRGPVARTGSRRRTTPRERGVPRRPARRRRPVFFSVYGSIEPAVDSIQLGRSLDGGATFEMSRRVASLFTEDIAGVRAPPFVSADVDAGGTVYATWADCRFSAECTANSIVLARSRDGVSWTQPRSVSRLGPAETAVDRFVPALAVDPPTPCPGPKPGGRRLLGDAVARLRGMPGRGRAPRSGRATGGRTWRAPVRLNAESIPLGWVADTGLGRMLADYVSMSYVGGRPVAVLSLATEPVAGELRQSIYATTRAP